MASPSRRFSWGHRHRGARGSCLNRGGPRPRCGEDRSGAVYIEYGSGEGEYYGLTADPYQLERTELSGRLDALRDLCEGFVHGGRGHPIAQDGRGHRGRSILRPRERGVRTRGRQRITRGRAAGSLRLRVQLGRSPRRDSRGSSRRATARSGADPRWGSLREA
jgi:hypothetical protein